MKTKRKIRWHHPTQRPQHSGTYYARLTAPYLGFGEKLLHIKYDEEDGWGDVQNTKPPYKTSPHPEHFVWCGKLDILDAIDETPWAAGVYWVRTPVSAPRHMNSVLHEVWYSYWDGKKWFKRSVGLRGATPKTTPWEADAYLNSGVRVWWEDVDLEPASPAPPTKPIPYPGTIDTYRVYIPLKNGEVATMYSYWNGEYWGSLETTPREAYAAKFVRSKTLNPVQFFEYAIAHIEF